MDVMLGKIWETNGMSRMSMQPFLLVRVIVIVDINKFQEVFEYFLAMGQSRFSWQSQNVLTYN